MKLHRWQTWLLLLLLVAVTQGGSFTCVYHDPDHHDHDHDHEHEHVQPGR